MDADAIREAFESVLSDDAIDALVQASGLQRRQRKLDARRLVRAAIVSAASSRGGRQAALLEAYFELGGPRVVRGAGYAWFTGAFEQAMAAVRLGSINHPWAAAAEHQVDIIANSRKLAAWTACCSRTELGGC